MYEDMPMLEPTAYSGPFLHNEDYMSYWDRIERERYEQSKQPVRKAGDAPVFTDSQCALCHRSVQEGEALVRDGGRVAHIECVRTLTRLIEAGRPKEYVPAPNLEAVRQDGAESERRLGATKKAIELDRTLDRYIKNRLIYK